MHSHTMFPFLQSTNLDSLNLNEDLKTASSQCNTGISTFANSGLNRKASHQSFLFSLPLFTMWKIWRPLEDDGSTR